MGNTFHNFIGIGERSRAHSKRWRVMMANSSFWWGGKQQLCWAIFHRLQWEMLPSHAAAAAWRRFSLRAFCHNAIIIVAKKFFNHQLSLWTHISARLWFKSAFASCSFTIDYTIYQSESQCKYLFTGANHINTQTHWQISTHFFRFGVFRNSLFLAMVCVDVGHHSERYWAP